MDRRTFLAGTVRCSSPRRSPPRRSRREGLADRFSWRLLTPRRGRLHLQAFRTACASTATLRAGTSSSSFDSRRATTSDYPRSLRELVRLNVDVIVTPRPRPRWRSRRQRRPYPSSCSGSPTPSSAGLVASLARPGGNITGLTTLSRGLGGKVDRTARELVPKLSRAGRICWDPSTQLGAQCKTCKRWPRGTGSRWCRRLPKVRILSELERVISALARERLESSNVPWPYSTRRQRSCELAVRHRSRRSACSRR